MAAKLSLVLVVDAGKGTAVLKRISPTTRKSGRMPTVSEETTAKLRALLTPANVFGTVSVKKGARLRRKSKRGER